MKSAAIRGIVFPIRCVRDAATLDVIKNLADDHTRTESKSLEKTCPMIDDPKDPDIQDVMKEEKSRGKRRVDMEARRKSEEIWKKVREALKSRTEREFMEAIRDLKLVDDPEKLREILKIWRASF